MTDQKSLADPNDTPEDVATLYSWANLHGAKYRDFSSSRAQAREEARLRVEEALAIEQQRQREEAERIAQEEAQLAARLAAEAAEAARQVEAERLAEIARQAEAERQAVLAAQQAQRQAAKQRAWQPPPAESYVADQELSFALPNQMQSPIPASQAEEETAALPAYLLPVQPLSATPPPAQAPISTPIANPIQIAAPIPVQVPAQALTQQPEPAQPARPVRPAYPVQAAPPPQNRFQNPEQSQNIYRPGAPVQQPVQQFGQQPSSQWQAAAPADPYLDYSDPQFLAAPYGAPQNQNFSSGWQQPESRESISRPAWLATDPVPNPVMQPAPVSAAPSYAAPQEFHYPAQPTNTRQYSQFAATAPIPVDYPSVTHAPAFTPPMAQQGPAYPQPQNPAYSGYHAAPTPNFNGQHENQGAFHAPIQSRSEDSVHASRDHLANRWFALKNVFDVSPAPAEPLPLLPPGRIPALAVFSLAGGVGKTSLVASLGRALSSRGERILLVDTAIYGLLPFFFGARDQRPGVLRTFNPPGIGVDAPIQLVTLDPDGQALESAPSEVHAERIGHGQAGSYPASDRRGPGRADQDWMIEEVGRFSRGIGRILIDLPTASGSTTRRILRLNPIILVPIVPDMNSVVSVGAIESFFRNSSGSSNSANKQNMPFYILNQFDYSLPLHLDVREILHEQIGDRLLPFALRRNAAVAESLAEGMTVMDYAPNTTVAEDYGTLADWVRSLAAPATVTNRGVRWSER